MYDCHLVSEELLEPFYCAYQSNVKSIRFRVATLFALKDYLSQKC
jgi:hypothetical protein